MNAFQPILFQTLHWNDGQQFDPAVRDVLLQAPEHDGSSVKAEMEHFTQQFFTNQSFATIV